MSKYQNGNKLFEYRCAYAFFLFICFCMFSVLRISVISSGSEYDVIQKNQSVYRVTIASKRGTIYDTNMIPLTNNIKEKYVVIPPVAEAIMDVPSFLSGKEKERALSELRENRLCIAKPQGKVNSNKISEVEIYKTDENDFIAEHIIGYTDSSGHGVCGIERAYDNYLYREDTVDAICEIDGKGNFLYGEKPTIQNDLSGILDGVRLTVDLRIQNIVSEKARNLQKGAIVVCDAKSGKIRAAKSKPDYSLGNIADSINKENSPMLNRTATAFSVGSVFKPCVAIAAMESGLGDITFDCKGKMHIIDRDFSCHLKSGHGIVNLNDAITFSCNTFFYNLGIKTGAEKILNKASVLNFGTSFRIAENYYIDEGNLTRGENITNDAQVANLSIGQGDLMLSPISMLTLYMSIANGGYYILPSVVESTVSGGKETEYKTTGKTRVMSEQTAETIKEALKNVVLMGTGSEAFTEDLEIAGKTATAQTGRYENGIEITNSWFCGFFPANDPRYVMIVMSDGNTDTSVAPVFSQIAREINLLS